MAARTNTVDPITGGTPTHPGYINIRFQHGRAVVTMRGDPEPVLERGPDEPISPDAPPFGPTAQLTLEQVDWDQFVAEATRERGLVPGG